MAIASIGIFINGLTALLFMRGRKSDINIRGAFLHMATDALVSAGVVITGALALWQGWNFLDPLVSLLIAVVILVSTWRLFYESLHLLFDGVPKEIELPKVRSFLESLEGVSNVHDLHIWAMSSSQIAMTVHLVMPNGIESDRFLEYIANELHDKFEIVHPTIQIERQLANHGCQ
jgi:cobalt-zinc-cadmium efflux system protein